MPRYSKRSRSKLETAHPLLQDLFHEVIKHADCTILEGHRSEARQNMLYRQGKSKVQYPDSRHNALPSMAVDVAPYPIDWEDVRRFYYFGGTVCGIAFVLDIPLRWGGDWDGDLQVKDQNFNDLVHFELKLTEGET